MFKDLTGCRIWGKEILGHWFLFEKHEKCDCSYCKELFVTKYVGFAKGKGKFHWTIIQWKWNGFDYYFRWT